jgi:hypothetical protein
MFDRHTRSLAGGGSDNLFSRGAAVSAAAESTLHGASAALLAQHHQRKLSKLARRRQRSKRGSRRCKPRWRRCTASPPPFAVATLEDVIPISRSPAGLRLRGFQETQGPRRRRSGAENERDGGPPKHGASARPEPPRMCRVGRVDSDPARWLRRILCFCMVCHCQRISIIGCSHVGVTCAHALLQSPCAAKSSSSTRTTNVFAEKRWISGKPRP